MFYNKLGYSNIRLPITYEKGRHMFIYDRNKNTFPEEVFIHEYLHSLESISEDYGYRYPSIHDYESFGYQNHSIFKLKNWYTDFLNQDITNKNIEEFYGLHKDVYKYANIVNREDFSKAKELDFDKEPDNIVEALKLLIKTITHNMKSIVNLVKGNDEVLENETYENMIYTNEVIVNVIN